MTNSSGSAGRSADDSARRMREKAERLQRQAENYEKGAAGERHVASLLDALPVEYLVLHDLSIPGSKANIDHLVIGPAGVWAIDTKAYSGELKAGRDMLWRGRIPIRKECETAQWEADQIAHWLQHPVYTALCFVGTVLPAPVTYLGQVAVCPSDVIVPLLLSVPRVQIDQARLHEMFDRASRLVRDPSSIRRPPVAAPQLQTSIPVEPPPPPAPFVVASPPPPERRTSSHKPRKAAKPVEKPEPLIIRGVLLRLLAGVTILAAAVFLSGPVSRVISRWFAESVKETLPTFGTTTTTSVPDAVDTWPVVTLNCPAPTQHWTATIAPSTDAPDATGFYVWYRLTVDGSWYAWGHFIPGTTTLPDLGNIQPGTQFAVRFNRAELPDASTAAKHVDLPAGPDC